MKRLIIFFWFQFLLEMFSAVAIFDLQIHETAGQAFCHGQKIILKHVVVFLSCFICAVKVGAAARLTNAPPANGKVVIGWSSRGSLETATRLAGPWMSVTNATNPYTHPIASGA